MKNSSLGDSQNDTGALRRAHFPIFSREIHGHRLVYLDSAASAQKPASVLEAMRRVYQESYANVHRGLHTLGQEVTDAYERSRATIAQFINAASADEVVFVRGATEAINLVAACLGRTLLQQGDEVLLTTLEHHSNIVPWQMLREERGIVLKVVDPTPEGALDVDRVQRSLTRRTRLVAVTHISNVLGTVLPIREIAACAHSAGARLLVDGCQAVPHVSVDVQDLDADFYVFSGHKMYGPTGIGVLYGKRPLLENFPPWQGGGEMIVRVSFERTTFKTPPHRFEAGTPPFVEAIGLAAAAAYLQALDRQALLRDEQNLLASARERLSCIPGVRLLGSEQAAAVLSFVISDVHPHDVATILDQSGIAVRAGHHCAQPLMAHLDVPGTVRVSVGVYNDSDDLDALEEGLWKVRRVFDQ